MIETETAERCWKCAGRVAVNRCGRGDMGDDCETLEEQGVRLAKRRAEVDDPFFRATTRSFIRTFAEVLVKVAGAEVSGKAAFLFFEKMHDACERYRETDDLTVLREPDQFAKQAVHEATLMPSMGFALVEREPSTLLMEHVLVAKWKELTK
jgi:hypothetical protein